MDSTPAHINTSPSAHLEWRARRRVNALHRGTAETVDGHATDRLRQFGQQHDQPRNIEALLAFRERATQQ